MLNRTHEHNFRTSVPDALLGRTLATFSKPSTNARYTLVSGADACVGSVGGGEYGLNPRSNYIYAFERV